MDMLRELTYWHWWILAVVLISIEVLAPGTFLLWLGIAAAATGLTKFLLPDLGWELQAVIFAVSAVLAIWAGRVWVRRHPMTSDKPNLNRRGAEHVGRHFELTEPVIGGAGKLVIDGVIWRIAGPDMPIGTRIVVVGIDGTLLRVDRS